MAALEAHLRGPQGRSGLGLAEGGPARVVASRRDGETLYLVIEEPGTPQRLLCRAFTEVNGRMAMVSTTADPADGGDAVALLARAVAMVDALKAANAVAAQVGPTPTRRPIRA